MEVNITPTAHSRKNGYDLAIRMHSHGWAKTDLTRDQLRQIRDTIDEFLGPDDALTTPPNSDTLEE